MSQEAEKLYVFDPMSKVLSKEIKFLVKLSQDIIIEPDRCFVEQRQIIVIYMPSEPNALFPYKLSVIGRVSTFFE